MEKATTRIDSWLWMVRIFSSRTKATAACQDSHVLINGTAVKPSKIVSGQEVIQVKRKGILLEFRVLGIPKSRVSAGQTITYAEDITSPEEKEKLKLKQAFIYFSGKRPSKSGRPTKKNARDQSDFLRSLEQDE